MLKTTVCKWVTPDGSIVGSTNTYGPLASQLALQGMQSGSAGPSNFKKTAYQYYKRFWGIVYDAEKQIARGRGRGSVDRPEARNQKTSDIVTTQRNLSSAADNFKCDWGDFVSAAPVARYRPRDPDPVPPEMPSGSPRPRPSPVSSPGPSTPKPATCRQPSSSRPSSLSTTPCSTTAVLAAAGSPRRTPGPPASTSPSLASLSPYYNWSEPSSPCPTTATPSPLHRSAASSPPLQSPLPSPAYSKPQSQSESQSPSPRRIPAHQRTLANSSSMQRRLQDKLSQVAPPPPPPPPLRSPALGVEADGAVCVVTISPGAVALLKHAQGLLAACSAADSGEAAVVNVAAAENVAAAAATGGCAAAASASDPAAVSFASLCRRAGGPAAAFQPPTETAQAMAMAVAVAAAAATRDAIHTPDMRLPMGALRAGADGALGAATCTSPRRQGPLPSELTQGTPNGSTRARPAPRGSTAAAKPPRPPRPPPSPSSTAGAAAATLPASPDPLTPVRQREGSSGGGWDAVAVFSVRPPLARMSASAKALGAHSRSLKRLPWVAREAEGDKTQEGASWAAVRQEEGRVALQAALSGRWAW